MSIAIDPNTLIQYGLVFLLGLFIGGFLFSGGGRKWKHRHDAEVDRRRELETRYQDAEKEWRERDALRAAALKDKGVVVDRDGNGVDDRREI